MIVHNYFNINNMFISVFHVFLFNCQFEYNIDTTKTLFLKIIRQIANINSTSKVVVCWHLIINSKVVIRHHITRLFIKLLTRIMKDNYQKNLNLDHRYCGCSSQILLMKFFESLAYLYSTIFWWCSWWFGVSINKY